MSFAKKLADTVKKVLQGVNDAVDNPLAWTVTKKVSSAFDGGTADAHGDESGTGNPYTLFNVTGDVALKGVVGIINTSLTGASATLEVGLAGNTAKLIAQATGTDLDDGDVWTDAGSEAAIDKLADGGLFFINDGGDIIETVATADVTAGQIDYYAIWAPLEIGASVKAAE